MKRIGPLCWCIHDVLDHDRTGCRRCAYRTRGSLALRDIPGHGFRATFAPVVPMVLAEFP